MKTVELVQVVLDISEKYRLYIKDETTPSINYDVLHLALNTLITDITLEQLDKLPKTAYLTIKELRNNIYQKTSKEYKEEYEEQKKSKKKAELKTQQPKRRIGFI